MPLLNMGVTWSADDDSDADEYKFSEDIQVPITRTRTTDMVWWGDGSQRVAKSLRTLYDQVNAAHPDRDKSNDGTIGDTAHQARISDHNPDGEGVVRALDITHDPAHGFDSYAFAEILRQNRDPRAKYVISNHRIWSATNHPYEWRPYSGSNPHTKHVHVSVVSDDKRADDTRSWVIDASQQRKEPPVVGRMLAITATVFGGGNDPQTSAYDGHLINETELGVALPYHFPGERRLVRVFANGKSVVAHIVDVGPWNDSPGDQYWIGTGRPLSETQFAQRLTAQNGRVPTNDAGIDLTPALAAALGIDGKGKVDWEFADTQPPLPPPPPPSEVSLVTLDARLTRLEKIVAALPDKQTPAAPQLHLDPQAIEKLIAQFTKDAAVVSTQKPPDLSILAPLFPAFAGYGGIIGYGLLWLIQIGGHIGTAGILDPTAGTPTGGILTALLATLGGTGIFARIGQLIKSRQQKP
jgi:hypothetical protein